MKYFLCIAATLLLSSCWHNMQDDGYAGENAHRYHHRDAKQMEHHNHRVRSGTAAAHRHDHKGNKEEAARHTAMHGGSDEMAHHHHHMTAGETAAHSNDHAQ